MTEMYELEVLQYERHLITMMTEWESSEEEDDDSSVSTYDNRQITPEPPAQIESSRVLLNYKNEIIAVSNELYRKFNAYMISPQLYPYIGQEKKKFLEKQFKHQAGDDLMDIDVDYGKEFSNYWKKRVLVLRKETLDREKQKLMDKYKAVIPECILEAQEKDSDVEIVEDVVVVSSDDEPWKNHRERIHWAVKTEVKPRFVNNWFPIKHIAQKAYLLSSNWPSNKQWNQLR